MSIKRGNSKQLAKDKEQLKEKVKDMEAVNRELNRQKDDDEKKIRELEAEIGRVKSAVIPVVTEALQTKPFRDRVRTLGWKLKYFKIISYHYTL